MKNKNPKQMSPNGLQQIYALFFIAALRAAEYYRVDDSLQDVNYLVILLGFCERRDRASAGQYSQNNLGPVSKK